MNELIKADTISGKIYLIRGLQVMLDSDLAELYGVPAKRLNEQVKRNIDRFPEEFRFQLDEEDIANLRCQIGASRQVSQSVIPSGHLNLRSQNATLNGQHGGRRYPPVEIVLFGDAHDRFLILDGKEVYHLGASLKDLGRKWFAFSKIEKDALMVAGKLEKKRGKI